MCLTNKCVEIWNNKYTEVITKITTRIYGSCNEERKESTIKYTARENSREMWPRSMKNVLVKESQDVLLCNGNRTSQQIKLELPE